MSRGRIVMGLLFFPRGGSAYVVRYLSPALARAGWSVSLAVGSLGAPGEETHAPTFFDGLDVHVLDSTDAVRVFEAGGDAIAAPQPMHPSYEDRADVPDVVFASVPPELAEHLSAAWDAPLRAAGADHADVLHLHHLTPQLDAAHRCWPHVPLVVHLHGTELKLIEAIEERVAVAAALGETLATMPAAAAKIAGAPGLDTAQLEMLRTTRWGSWRHGEFWTARFKQQAQLADHLITVSPQNRDAAISMLGIEPDHVTALPNGVDIERFRPQPRTPGSRRAAFRRALVEDPQGWTESGPPGTLAYTDADLDRLLGVEDDATVLLFVGRFLGFKRVPALVRAFAQARRRFTRPGSLVIWGGHPGEWEGEHPATVAEEVGADGIYFAGWRGHDDLPSGLAACDAIVVPSVDDPYPQVPLEAMAVGLPVVACRSGGLRSMVNLDPARPTGWLVPPDDADALADALTTVVNDPADTAARGANALAHARAELSWDGLVTRFEAAYTQAAERHRTPST
ncbi:MAG: glycosyltransferase family 4 protein [Acidimicrobiia bacterium]|nr:glycosyltransferase family 4 protein [Acidimicrobiia bacterium]